ncbi:MAG TPA: fibronectin type III domain-containing protein [Planctomycetota bacterium]|nr:fibronectin type III domain-containing protein [Planctomycetota bacterium]
MRSFTAGEKLQFEIRDLLDHPLYHWPRTLLTYPVRFAGDVRPEQLRLANPGTGEAVPFQLSDVRLEKGRVAFACVSFFSDLPSNAVRQFELSAADGSAPPAADGPAVSERTERKTIVLDSGAMKVRIPASQKVKGDAPGPIMQVSRGGEWLGSSQIISPKYRVLRIETTRLEAGPLFITYRISYTFEKDVVWDLDARYTATVRCVQGYDFVNFKEEMDGFAKNEGAAWKLTWTDFHPTHRQAPNHPTSRYTGQRGFARYDWEKIDQSLIATAHGVTNMAGSGGRLPFRLGPYQPWTAYDRVTSANFYDDRTNDSVGVFIDHLDGWQDHEYAIWTSSDTLAVAYFHLDGAFWWNWPLVTGTRSTCVACYDHAKDIDVMEQLEAARLKDSEGSSYGIPITPMSYSLFLQNWYGTFDLNCVKDWVLDYPAASEHPPVVFRDGAVDGPAQLLERVFHCEPVAFAPVAGIRQGGLNPVCARNVYGWFIDGYNRALPQMTDRQRQRLTAMYLLMGYIHADENLMPMHIMLSGHPNFLSDVKSAAPLFAFLFPKHPMAADWADQFEKFLELNTRYHTRPDVKSWEAHGGRWTENLGTYVWAFLRPAIRPSFALQKYVDGKNRFAKPQIAQIGDWLVNALTAPFNGENPDFYRNADGSLDAHYWGLVTPQDGPRRLHPPQGAHSARRMPPRTMWLLGHLLRQYCPLLAEHMMWAAKPTDDDAEHMKNRPDPWQIMFDGLPDNRGTNPHLESSKFTGYGIMLRSAVDTPDEVSIHLQQIDAGPNYRWGGPGEGGCGVIYFYAAGKAYSHNGREDVGDRSCGDADFCCNFGVWKNGAFRSIGRNNLTQPLYDLRLAQYAELLPRHDSPYSWPEYLSRSVMLVGSDYFVTYDDVFGDGVWHRFSWFTHAAEQLPNIQVVRGDARNDVRITNVSGVETKGVWYDGTGDFMAVISHKPGISVARENFGCRVSTDASDDLIFRNPDGVTWSAKGDAFTGTAGIIRKKKDARTELAIFHGTQIAAAGLTLAVDNPDLGISAAFADPAEAAGTYFSRTGGQLTITAGKPLAEAAAIYVDGARLDSQRTENGLAAALPPGRHCWQLTAGLPTPIPPAIIRTENRSGAATVDQPAAIAKELAIALTGLRNGTKVHVRTIAINDQCEGEPSREYPIYVTDAAPLPPDGLTLHLAKGSVQLDWGEVLGVTEYRVYRRVKGAADFTQVYHGRQRSCTDAAPGVIPAFDVPGHAANAARPAGDYTIYEYAVTAVNGNGESTKPTPVDTDPASWVNWDPKPHERFRRYDSVEGPVYYPE